MKVKKRYKLVLKSWLDSLNLELERVEWYHKLYRIFYIEGGARRYVGLFRNDKYYYSRTVETSLRVCFNMLLVRGVKSRIKNYEG